MNLVTSITLSRETGLSILAPVKFGLFIKFREVKGVPQSESLSSDLQKKYGVSGNFECTAVEIDVSKSNKIKELGAPWLPWGIDESDFKKDYFFLV